MQTISVRGDGVASAVRCECQCSSRFRSCPCSFCIHLLITKEVAGYADYVTESEWINRTLRTTAGFLKVFSQMPTIEQDEIKKEMDAIYIRTYSKKR